MPALANFFAGLLANFFAGLGKSTFKKLTAVAAAIAALAVAAGVLLATFNTAISQLVPVLPGIVLIPASWVVPSNIPECITARVVVGVAIMAYQWAKTVTVVGATA